MSATALALNAYRSISCVLYLLRHTFALKQLSKPENTDAEVAAWLGVEVGEMKRYPGLITAPVDIA